MKGLLIKDFKLLKGQKNFFVLIGLHQQTTKYMESPKNGTLSMVT